MITLKYLAAWLKLTLGFAAGAGVATLVTLGGLHSVLWTVVALLVTASIYLAITSAMVSDWRTQRGNAVYRFDSVSAGDRW